MSEVNSAMAGYLKQVNRLMRESCGVSYSEVAEGLDGGYGVMGRAFQGGVPVAAFVEGIAATHGLARAAGSGRDKARQYNLRRAAVAEYARETEGWEIGTDGAAYRAERDGLRRLDVAYSARHDRWGFAVFTAPDGVLESVANDPLNRRRPGQGIDWAFVAAAHDIGDALALAEYRQPPPMPESEPPALRM